MYTGILPTSIVACFVNPHEVADTVYDIEALRFVAGELNTPVQWKSYIDQMAAIGFDIVVLTTLPEESAASYETYKNNIVLINTYIM
mgnify:CR=1 FL=1